MKIKLTRNKYTLIDDENFKWLSQWKWLCQKTQWGEYAARKENYKGKYIYMHRLLLGAKEGEYVDHINGDGLDNRHNNLRICTNAENGRNRKKLNRNNTSGFRGVTRYEQSNNWIAQIMVNRKRINLGIFDNKEDAYCIYLKARRRYFGEFA